MNIQPKEYSELWRDPCNWRLYIFYVCREDPRLMVPKRLRVTGLTLNFAHPKAILLFLGLLAVVLVPITIVNAIDLSTLPWVPTVTITLSVLAALALTWWASKLRIK
ncbi:MAG: hypothetical protein E4H27_04835 [Anaerolineales bacterium]|nr:MAG: hypothetical protein E4H27_04835 [Anaerolineales bacterium]